MGSCASCGAEGVTPARACPRCGAVAAPELELDLPATAHARVVAPRKKVDETAPLELAIDPRALVAERTAEAHGSGVVSMEVASSGARGPGSAAASVQVVRGATAMSET